MDAFEYYKNRLKYHILKCVKRGNFTLSSGKKSDFYIDCKQELLAPECMEYVAACIKHMPSYAHKYRTVAGVTSGADPIICSCVAYNKNNGLFIRKQEKKYGTTKKIEGKITSLDSTVLLVDDVLTTGKALKYAYDAIIEANLKPVSIVVVVDRQENDAKVEIERYTGLVLKSIFIKKELMNFENRNWLWDIVGR